MFYVRFDRLLLLKSFNYSGYFHLLLFVWFSLRTWKFPILNHYFVSFKLPFSFGVDDVFALIGLEKIEFSFLLCGAYKSNILIR